MDAVFDVTDNAVTCPLKDPVTVKPSVILASPITSSLYAGVVVPIPTLPPSGFSSSWYTVVLFMYLDCI